MKRGQAIFRPVEIASEIIDDPSISFKAKGIYLALPPGRVDASRLIRLSLDGRDAVYVGINELLAAGYLLSPKTTNRTPRIGDRDWKSTRERILERDGHRCRYCGATPDRLTVDHVIPLSRGGSHDDSNLVTACYPCNNGKRDLTVEEWRGVQTR